MSRKKHILTCGQCQYFDGVDYCKLHHFAVDSKDEICSFMKDIETDLPLSEDEKLPIAKDPEGGIYV